MTLNIGNRINPVQWVILCAQNCKHHTHFLQYEFLVHCAVQYLGLPTGCINPCQTCIMQEATVM